MMPPSASFGPPAANGTMIVIGRDGYVCASAVPVKTMQLAAAMATSANTRLAIICPRDRCGAEARAPMCRHWSRPQNNFSCFRNARPPWAPTLTLNSRDFGTSRWQLSDKITTIAGVHVRGRSTLWPFHFCSAGGPLGRRLPRGGPLPGGRAVRQREDCRRLHGPLGRCTDGGDFRCKTTCWATQGTRSRLASDFRSARDVDGHAASLKSAA
jgi:hypothetical protein